MSRKKDTVLAWHWTNGNKLRDGSALPRKGRWLKHKGPVAICESGLHASESLLDSLRYAPGRVLHRVECASIVDRQADKFVCRERKIIRSADMKAALVKWTHECAELAKWFAADAATYAAIYAGADAAIYAATAAGAAAIYAATAAATAAADAATYAAIYAGADAAIYAGATATYAATAATYAADAATAAAACQQTRRTVEARLIELFEETAK